MPWLLQTTCVASMCVGSGILALCILQIGTFQINGETLSWGQIRAAGYYPFLVIDALAMMIAGFGIWMRRGWSRWLIVLFYVFASPIEIIYSRSHEQEVHRMLWGGVIIAVAHAGFFYWYLFYKQKKAFD
jgi:cytochrome b561